MTRELPIVCERCHVHQARLLLGKGIVVCNWCYRNPEDVIRDLPDPRRQLLDEITRMSDEIE